MICFTELLDSSMQFRFQGFRVPDIFELAGVNILSRDPAFWSKFTAEKICNFKIGPETKKFSTVPYVVNLVLTVGQIIHPCEGA